MQKWANICSLVTIGLLFLAQFSMESPERPAAHSMNIGYVPSAVIEVIDAPAALICRMNSIRSAISSMRTAHPSGSLLMFLVCGHKNGEPFPIPQICVTNS